MKVEKGNIGVYFNDELLGQITDFKLKMFKDSGNGVLLLKGLRKKGKK